MEIKSDTQLTKREKKSF